MAQVQGSASFFGQGPVTQSLNNIFGDPTSTGRVSHYTVLHSIESSSPVPTTLNTTSVSINTTSSQTSATSSVAPSSNSSASLPSGSTTPAPIGAVAGGIIGGLAIIALLPLVCFCCFKRGRYYRRSTLTLSSQEELGKSAAATATTATIVTFPTNFSPRVSLGTIPFQPKSSRSTTGSSAEAAYAPGNTIEDSSSPQTNSTLAAAYEIFDRRIALLPTETSTSQPDSHDNSIGSTLLGLPSNNTGERHAFRTKMQCLQQLVVELNIEIEQGREEGVRAAKLKGRITELMPREDSSGLGNYLQVRRESMVRSGSPPPYA